MEPDNTEDSEYQRFLTDFSGTCIRSVAKLQTKCIRRNYPLKSEVLLLVNNIIT